MVNERLLYTILGHVILLAGPVTAIIVLALQLRACRRGLDDLSAICAKRREEIADLQGMLRAMRKQRRSRSRPHSRIERKHT